MKIFNFVIPLFLAFQTLVAGDDQITGSVIKKGGGPLAGVTVLLKAKKVSAVTRADGNSVCFPCCDPDEYITGANLIVLFAKQCRRNFRGHGEAQR